MVSPLSLCHRVIPRRAYNELILRNVKSAVPDLGGYRFLWRKNDLMRNCLNWLLAYLADTVGDTTSNFENHTAQKNTSEFLFLVQFLPMRLTSTCSINSLKYMRDSFTFFWRVYEKAAICGFRHQIRDISLGFLVLIFLKQLNPINFTAVHFILIPLHKYSDLSQ